MAFSAPGKSPCPDSAVKGFHHPKPLFHSRAVPRIAELVPNQPTAPAKASPCGIAVLPPKSLCKPAQLCDKSCAAAGSAARYSRGKRRRRACTARILSLIALQQFGLAGNSLAWHSQRSHRPHRRLIDPIDAGEEPFRQAAARTGQPPVPFPRPRWVRRRPLVCVLALGFCFLPGYAAVAANAPLMRFEYSLPRMGTMFRIEMYATQAARASEAAEAAFARAEDLEQIMSDYRPTSELTTLDREGAKAPFPVSNDLYDVLAKSQWVSQLSGGVFDVSVGPLVGLWRAARRSGHVPDAAEVAKARALVDYHNIVLDPATHTVFLKRPGMKLDLGAIGKGYAADQMLAVLESQGIRRAMVVAGGEVVTGEPPPGKSGWTVAVDTADKSPGQHSCLLVLSGAAVSTSGDEHQYFLSEGRRYSHVVNALTGWPLEGQNSATVLARDSTTADGLATAFSLMSIKDGIRVAESIPGVAVMFVRQVDGDWKTYTSRGFPTSCRKSPKGGK